MKRFVAEQNIRHFKHLLETETDPERREVIARLLREAKRELELLEKAAGEEEGDQQSQTNDNGERRDDQYGSSKGKG